MGWGNIIGWLIDRFLKGKDVSRPVPPVVPITKHNKVPNRAIFFEIIKQSLFHNLLETQVKGMTVILDEWENSKHTDLRWLACMFGNTFHETGRTMTPIKEYGSSAYFIKRYWENKQVSKQLGNTSAEDAVKYSGAGFIQLTGRTNFAKMGKLIGFDLLNHPELALDYGIATRIMFEGMVNGRFTGKALEDYFDDKTEDWVQSRRIINGLDKANEIAAYSKKFYAAIKASQ